MFFGEQAFHPCPSVKSVVYSPSLPWKISGGSTLEGSASPRYGTFHQFISSAPFRVAGFGARHRLEYGGLKQKRLYKKTMAIKQNETSLARIARKSRLRAHAPYSKFLVGAALESEGGKVFSGCNVENISYGLTICAERNAVFAAVAAGVRSFRRIVIVADSKEPVTPCGACRQVLSEFSENMEIISINLKGQKFRASLAELLPRSKAGILDHPCST